MTSQLPNPRYERKFVVTDRSLADVIALVRRHPATFREVYPPRIVNNVYLDSPALGDYFDHINGAPNRVKTRIRWYGELSGPVAKPTLERKLKQGMIGGKLSYGLAGFTVNGCVPRPELEHALDGSVLPDALRAAMRHLQPSLINSYHRHYFLSADALFRLTIDKQIRFFTANNRNGWQNPYRNREVAIVIELKYEPPYEDRAGLVINRLPFRLSRCSKYVLGLETAGMG